MRAVDQQVVETNLNQYLINIIFADRDSIDLQHFCLCVWIYRRFERHALVDKYSLSEEEFLLVLGESQINPYLLRLIDSFYQPTLEELEGSYSERKKFTEDDYLVTFLQTKSQTKSRLAHREDKGGAEADKSKNRVQVYNVFAFRGDSKLRFDQFLLFWKVSWLFFNMDVNLSGNVNFLEMRQAIEDYRAPITLSDDEQSDLQYGLDIIGSPDTNQLDIKQFYTLFVYKQVFQFYRESTLVAFVNEPHL